MKNKLIYFLFILFIFFNCEVKAITFDEIKVGAVFYHYSFFYDAMNWIDEDNYLSFAYVDEEENLLGFYTFTSVKNPNSTIQTDTFIYVDFSAFNNNYVIDRMYFVDNIVVGDSYQIISKNNNVDFCNKYDEVQNSDLCINKDNKTYNLLVFKNIGSFLAKFDFKCTEKVLIGEEIKCDYYVNFERPIENIIFDFKYEDYEILNIVSDWKFSFNENDGVYVFYGGVFDYPNKPLFSITLKPKNYTVGVHNIETSLSIVYGRVADEGPSGLISEIKNSVVSVIDENNSFDKSDNDSLNDNKKVENKNDLVEEDGKEDEKNPNTSDMSVILILMSLIISGMICLKLSNILLMK